MPSSFRKDVGMQYSYAIFRTIDAMWYANHSQFVSDNRRNHSLHFDCVYIRISINKVYSLGWLGSELLVNINPPELFYPSFFVT